MPDPPEIPVDVPAAVPLGIPPSPPPSSPPTRKLKRSRAAVVLALILGLFLGVICVGAIGWLVLSRNSGRALLSHLWSAMTGRTLTIDVSQPTVVDRIQR